MGLSTDGLAITHPLHSWAYQQAAKSKKHSYKAFWRGKQTSVRADTTYEAQTLAAHYFRCKKAHEIALQKEEDKAIMQMAEYHRPYDCQY